jgi:hypothetical protein
MRQHDRLITSATRLDEWDKSLALASLGEAMTHLNKENRVHGTVNPEYLYEAMQNIDIAALDASQHDRIIDAIERMDDVSYKSDALGAMSRGMKHLSETQRHRVVDAMIAIEFGHRSTP